MLNDIQITSDYMSRWVVLKRRVGAVTSQRVLSIGRKIFNYKEALQDINIEEYLKNPLTCDCSHSPFQYNPSGHV
jgi:hypothetical protein